MSINILKLIFKFAAFLLEKYSMIRDDQAWSEDEQGLMARPVNSSVLRTSCYWNRQKVRLRLIALVLIITSICNIALYYLTFDSRIGRNAHDTEIITILRVSGSLIGLSLVICGCVTLWNARKTKWQSCVAGQTIVLAGLWTILVPLGWFWLERCCGNEFKKQRIIAIATIIGCGKHRTYALEDGPVADGRSENLFPKGMDLLS
jgi:hypothetical protein